MSQELTDWAPYTYRWQQTANNQELWLCARLLIPLSLIDTIPTTERHKRRTEVGLFQSRMIQSVQTLRRKYADRTPQQPPSPLWLTKYVAQALPPRETPQNLRNHVGAPMWCGTKRKRKTKVATEEPIDLDQWIRDARGAGDNGAVAWFATRANNTAQDEHPKKRRRLNVDTQRPKQYSKTADSLAQEHARQAHDIYHRPHAAAVARQHLRTLHMCYTNTLTANADYHRLVTKLVEEQMQAQQLLDTHAHLCQTRRQSYEQAKYDTGSWYADVKLLLLVSNRYRRLSVGTEKLLDLYQPQAAYMWHQQQHLTDMTQCYHDACKHKTTHYRHTTRLAQQTIYLIRKRPREHLDPTLWEVPLQPLPKRHKTHWDPNEWEMPMT